MNHVITQLYIRDKRHETERLGSMHTLRKLKRVV